MKRSPLSLRAEACTREHAQRHARSLTPPLLTAHREGHAFLVSATVLGGMVLGSPAASQAAPASCEANHISVRPGMLPAAAGLSRQHLQ